MKKGLNECFLRNVKQYQFSSREKYKRAETVYMLIAQTQITNSDLFNK